MNKYLLLKKRGKKQLFQWKKDVKQLLMMVNNALDEKKNHNFCGKHKLKQPFGVVSDVNINNFNFISQSNPNFIEVKKFTYTKILNT